MNEKFKREVIITKNGVKRILRPIKPVNKTRAQLAAQAMSRKKAAKFSNDSSCRSSLCNRRFNALLAEKFGHKYFCSKRCLNGLSPVKEKHKNPYHGMKQRKIARKVKELHQKQKANVTIEGFYGTPEWRDLRWKTLRRFKFMCLACGRKPPEVKLHVDHIKPRSKYPHLELDPENLQILCEDCNLGKSNLSEDDLRPA